MDRDIALTMITALEAIKTDMTIINNATVVTVDANNRDMLAVNTGLDVGTPESREEDPEVEERPDPEEIETKETKGGK